MKKIGDLIETQIRNCSSVLFYFRPTFFLLIRRFRLFFPPCYFPSEMSAFRIALRPLQSARLYSTATPSRLASVAASTPSTLPKATSAAALHASGPLRNDWTREEIQSIYDSPFLELMYYGVSWRTGVHGLVMYGGLISVLSTPLLRPKHTVRTSILVKFNKRRFYLSRRVAVLRIASTVPNRQAIKQVCKLKRCWMIM